MRCKLALILSALLPLGIPLQPARRAGSGVALSASPPQTKVYSKAECLAESEISDALRKLSEGQPGSIDARRLLLKAANSSPMCRRLVVAATMKAMDKPDLDITRHPRDFNMWRDGSILLGELKAVEALDLLLSHLTTSNGEWSSTMSQKPALNGVIGMGPIAITKLELFMRQNPDRNVRQDTVLCIYFIGGQPALRALRLALYRESDQCVRRFISESINLLKQKGPALDNSKWFSAYLCKSE